MNRSTNIWGPDAKEFRPERWLEEGGIHGNADSIQGYHHLLTFSDGPRICLGRSFALAEFKVCNSVFDGEHFVNWNLIHAFGVTGSSIGACPELCIPIERRSEYEVQYGQNVIATTKSRW